VEMAVLASWDMWRDHSWPEVKIASGERIIYLWMNGHGDREASFTF
jgi:hypothetical protein